ncbi:MAG: alpha-galactosidase [Caldilineaceae bacterium]|nr:alpha-galactosidase [Caldilineaceae bacterium]
MSDNIHSAIVASTSPAGQAIWVLEGERTAYAFGLDRFGCLQHMYWGPRLRAASDYGEPSPALERFAHERVAGVSQEEYPAWGDIKYLEPCLKVAFADGVRSAMLRYAKAAILAGDEAPELVISFADDHYPLLVDLHYRLWGEHDLIERFAVIRNTGNEPINLEQTLSALWHLPLDETYRLRTLGGRWGGEFQISEVLAPLGKQIIESRRGITSAHANPWFGIDRNGSASETHGDVWFGALAYSGNWKLVVERNAYGQTMIAGGIHDFDHTWKLDAGESFTTPSFVAGFTAEGYGDASRLLHRFQLDVVMPRSTANTLLPVLYNSWYVTEFDVNFENQAAAARKAADLGIELFVMDDGWFGVRDDDTSGLGDWTVDKRKFPNGLTPLIDYVNSLGMEFGIWVEPEMVNIQSDLYARHPDWIYHFPTRPRSESRHQLVLNFGRADVQAFVLDFMHELLSNHNIRFVKWDMNRSFSEPGYPDAEDGREREVWVRHVQGLYRIFAELREAHPQVMFESCSSGGGRVDLGILRYVEDFWMSDNVDPLDNLLMYEGYSMAYAPKAKMMWVNDPFHWTNRAPSLTFRFHQAMTGALGVGANLLRWSAEEMTEAREHIAMYKRIRPIVQHGRLYRLASLREGDWAAFQYVGADDKETVVLVFLQASRFGASRRWLRLQGLAPDAQYRIEGAETVLSGAALMARGVQIELRGDLQSTLLHLKQI